MEIKDLGITQLWYLRRDIVLNSLFLDDYENRYGIPPEDVCNFMDGYVEYLCAMAQEEDFESDDIFDIIDEYDCKNNLYDYKTSICW